MAILNLLVLSSAGLLFSLIGAEPDYCKRGVKVSEAYQHCFEEAHYKYPYLPLRQPHEIIDGCMVEDYAEHTCSIVKQAALECFRRNVSHCDYRERLYAIADESGGACFGNHVNRDFKEYVLNFLQPVRGDSRCFILGERSYECYSQAGYEMDQKYPDLHLMSVDDFMAVADQFFDSVYNCYIKIYKSNRRICENWQIPLLLELQGTALPSLFGMTFTPRQMEKLELHGGCPKHLFLGKKPYWRVCYEESGSSSSNNKNKPPSSANEQQQLKGNKKGKKKEKAKHLSPRFLERLREKQ